MSTYQRNLATDLERHTSDIGIPPVVLEEAYYGGVEIAWKHDGERGLVREVWASIADVGPSVIIFSEPVFSSRNDDWVDISTDADPASLAERIKRYLSEEGL